MYRTIKFKVLFMTTMKITAFWDVMPCILVEVNHCQRIILAPLSG